jgi:hypothetical protein
MGCVENINIDLSRMLEYPKCAIRVSTKEEDELFLRLVKEQFPERTASWRGVLSNWDWYDGETTYTLFYEGGTEPERLSYERYSWFIANGYEVIQFSELAYPVADIEESEISFDMLLSQDSVSMTS